MKPSCARLRVILMNSSPICSLILRVCLDARVSFHRIAGRTILPDLSNVTNPCICPENEIPLICSAFKWSFSINRTIATVVPLTHSSGFCSLYPGAGCDKG